MPIEFPCPVCRQQVRTPDAAAGKKGKCPSCGAVLIIPAPAIAVLPPAPPGPLASPLVPPEAPPPPGTVEFPCPLCSRIVRTPAVAAGKKGRCPHCQEVIQIPEKSPGTTSIPTVIPTATTTPRPAGGRLPTARPLPQPKPAPEPEIIDLEEMDPSPPPPPAPKPVDGLTPLPSGPAKPVSGLTPIGPAPGGAVPGLTPLGPLKPVPPAPPPSPLAGLRPIPSELAAELSKPNPLGLPSSVLVGMPQSPFGATPSKAYESSAYPSSEYGSSGYGSSQYGSTPYYAPPISDANRRGLSWEREPSMESFTDTMNEVLGASDDTFRRMRRTGGVVNPIAFLIVGMVISQIANAIYGTILNAIIIASRGGPFPIEGLIIFGALQLIGGLIGVVLLAPIFAFIMAGIYHVLLSIVGGANAGFEATFRCVCFTYGSTFVLHAIPAIGPFIGLFYGIIVLINAFTQAHETSGGKASFAVFIVLLPLLLCGCGLGIMVALSAAAGAQ